jgi:cytochrome c biogenesis protein CcmG, thiol:disulfide interchange protein DsbE
MMWMRGRGRGDQSDENKEQRVADVTAEPSPAPERRRPWVLGLQLAAVGLVAALLALLIWRVIDQRRGAHLVSLIKEGKKPPAPSFALPVLWNRTETWPADTRKALTDGNLSPKELRGRPVVVNFWASWCVPCKEEAQVLAESARAHRGQIVFLAIDVQDFKSDARRFLKRFDTPYVSVRDGGGSTYGDYGLTGVPETYWIDARGRVVAHYPGQITRAQLEEGIREAEAAT